MTPFEAILILASFILVRLVLPTAVLLALGIILDKRQQARLL